MLRNLLLGVSAALVAAVMGCSTEPEPKSEAIPATPSTTASATTTSAQPPTKDAPALLPRVEASSRKGAHWLLSQQKDDATFGGPAEVGKTALALSAILASADATALRDDLRVKKAIAYVASMQQPDGSLSTPGEAGLANYQTSAAIAALVAYGDPAHKGIIEKAKQFLLTIQNKDGSWGYNSDKRGDLSNTQFTLDALKAAGLTEDSEAFKNCLAFLQRCQNRSESNKEEWAGNDGGAVYYPGSSKAGMIKLPDGKVILKSYGSMTYALLRGYVLCGLKPDDPRVQAAQKWLAENYTLDVNPGMPEDQKLQGLLYYYLSMAKALALLKSPDLALPDGTKRQWAKDLAERVIAMQEADGSWINNAMRWMENDPILATSYVLTALAECRALLAKP